MPTITTRVSRVLTVVAVALGFAVSAHAQATKPVASSTTVPVPTDDQTIQLDEYRVTALKEFSNIARVNKTPVSFAEIDKSDLDMAMGSRDMLYVLDDTPSFFISDGGGGMGDSTITMRGFSQRNINMLINGVPVNDLESGQYYASNWNDLQSMTSMIQAQRGLSNVTLTVPSIGGTINIITDAATDRAGVSFRFEAGKYGYNKEELRLSTGLLGKKFAATVVVSNKYQKGYKSGLYGTGQGYYMALSYQANPKNKLEFYAFAYPQMHGQMTYPGNLANVSTKLARQYGYTDAQLACFTEYGASYNPYYYKVSPSYSGKQYYWGGTHNRFYDDALMRAENYYYKPQVNLNWFSNLSRNTTLSTIFFYSGGSGGAAGTAYNTAANTTTSAVFAYAPYATGATTNVLPYDWDKVIKVNVGTNTYNNNTQQFNTTNSKTAGQSLGVLRNSVNSGNQYGLISKLTYAPTTALKFTAGVDWRTSTADHYYEIRDLLGGQYYIPTVAQSNDLDLNYSGGSAVANKRLGLGDRFNFDYTSYVNWLGSFISAEYNYKKISSFLTGGYGGTDYSSINHFKHNVDANGLPIASSEVKTTAPRYYGYQLKAGFRYDVTYWFSPYVNAGYVSKAPLMNAAIDSSGSRVKYAANEKISSYEIGMDFNTKNKKITARLNYYWMQWANQTVTNDFATANPPYTLQQNDVSANYGGLEFSIKYKMTNWLTFNVAGAFANWYYNKNSTAWTYDYNTQQLIGDTSQVVYNKGLKVSTAPQSSISYGFRLKPIKDLTIDFRAKWGDRYWSNYGTSTTPRTSKDDAVSTWRIPACTLCNLSAAYKLPIRKISGERSNITVDLYVNITNLFNTLAVQYAVDNYYYDTQTANAPAHSAQRAEINIYPPMAISGGIRVTF